MEDQFDTLSELMELLTQLEEQKKLIYVHFEQLVSQIIFEKITDQREIESVMDRLIDFGDDDRFRSLYKRLCRYVYNFYPQMVGEHIHIFRLQFGRDDYDDESEDGVQWDTQR